MALVQSFNSHGSQSNGGQYTFQKHIQLINKLIISKHTYQPNTFFPLPAKTCWSYIVILFLFISCMNVFIYGINFYYLNVDDNILFSYMLCCLFLNLMQVPEEKKSRSCKPQSKYVQFQNPSFVFCRFESRSKETRTRTEYM